MNRLEPVADQPGLWKNQDWTPGTPGAFVILIGASSYAHLAGGSGMAAKTNYGLGQLHVSAYTAYGLFNWVKNQYRFTPANEPACPIAQCWLLLAPTEEELTGIDPDVQRHLLAPTYTNIRMATRRWQATMEDLPRVIAEQSRSYFFFSGHGLEIYQDEHILLPSDWLNPDGREDDAINIRQLAKALSQLAIDDQYFFVDACRNGGSSLRRLVIKGDGLLTEGQSFMVNATCNGPILCASSAGVATVQPRHISEGYSLFGQALLDGLYGREGFRPECESGLCSVKFNPLHEFIINRYNQLLRQFGESGTHSIPQTGRITKPSGVVTHLLSGGVPSDAPQSVEQQKEQSFTTRLAIDLDPRLGFMGDSFQFLNRSHPDYDTFAYLPQKSAVGEPIQDNPLDWTTDHESLFLSSHDVFAREAIANLWDSLRLYSLESKKWINSLQVALHRVERTQDNRSYRLTISLPRLAGRHWIEFDYARLTYAFVLPGDVLAQDIRPENSDIPIYYTIEFTLARSAPGNSVRLSNTLAGLSPFNRTQFIHQMVPIWEKYASGLAIQALQEMEANQLQRIVIDKAESPTAAMMATLILFRAGRTDLIESEWMRNLKNWFPQRPDGPIIENEYWLRSDASAITVTQIIENIYEMNRRGLPYLNEVMGYAVRQVDDLLELENLSRTQRSMLLKLQRRFQRTLRYFQPGGLFSSFEARGRDIGLTPALLTALRSYDQ